MGAGRFGERQTSELTGSLRDPCLPQEQTSSGIPCWVGWGGVLTSPGTGSPLEATAELAPVRLLAFKTAPCHLITILIFASEPMPTFLSAIHFTPP